MSSPPYLALLLVTAVVCTNGGCTSKRETRLTSGTVSLVYRQDGDISIRTTTLSVHLNPQQVLSASLSENGKELTLASQAQRGDVIPSDYVTVAGKDVQTFVIDYSQISIREVNTRLGNCTRIQIPSRAGTNDWSLRKVLDVDLCSAFPQSAIWTAAYQNLGSTALEIDRVVQLAQTIAPSQTAGKGLWTFQGASLGWGRDQIFSLPVSYQEENPIGQMVLDGKGGGLPVNDFWDDQVGLAIGHIEPEAVACWMPVRTLAGHRVQVHLETRARQRLAPSVTMTTPRGFLTVHRGDFYNPLAIYSGMLRAQGVNFLKHSEDLYSPVWWTYAFGHNFRPAEVYNAIPKFKEFGIRWLIINNRWWDHYGDWMPRTDKFQSEAGFREMIARLHSHGLKSLLWWLPYGVQVRELPRSGLYNDPQGRPKPSPEIERMLSATATVALRNPDWLIQDQHGQPAPIARRLAALCPAYPPARDYMVQLATRMIRDWKADGLYMDVIYTVPPCYNPAHHHASPYDSVQQLAELFQEFRKVIEKYDPQGMLMICPCGTTMNHCLLPTTNEPVTADPVGSEQIRWRVKMYKALMGPTAPVFADRVESTQFQRVYSTEAEVGRDFASCMGTGGIIGTIFIWPQVDKLPGDLEYRGELDVMKLLLLTPEKETLWKKWFDLYRQKMLSSGEFLNLYTLGFDSPEGYVIRKSGSLYYAFFAPADRAWGIEKPPVLPESKDESWEGRLELRGLERSTSYQVVDYEHGTNLGKLNGSSPYFNTRFVNHLLLELTPLP